jgi:flagellar protein FlaG
MSIDKIVNVAGNGATPASQSVAAEKRERASVPAAAAEAVELPNVQIEEVARRLESYMESVSRSLEFRVDASSGRTVVSVRDAVTGDLIRQIPSEEVLRLAQMAEDQTIVLVNEKV